MTVASLAIAADVTSGGKNASLNPWWITFGRRLLQRGHFAPFLALVAAMLKLIGSLYAPVAK
jgi:hypothetical protein